MTLPRILRTIASLARILALALGVLVLVVAIYGVAGEIQTLHVGGFETFSVRDAMAFIALLATLLSSGLLLAAVPLRLRIPFPRARPSHQASPVYGFSTILAVGVGSTLGSPLFLLIPLNVMEYGIVSVVSLALAAILSLAMAKNNSNSYTVLKMNGLAAVGGPAFVRVAVGTRSARYFISRFSMAVANTALAAYCVLVFVLFVFGYLPDLLQGHGLGGLPTFFIVTAITVLFGVWFVMNSILERRFIRTIGFTQLVFTSVLVAILVIQSVMLGSAGGWNFRGLLAFPATSGLDIIGATVVNTGYLYILFFGFQEIQALDREARDTSEIPLISQLRRGYVLDKHRYFGIAMIATVVIAASVNILYALAVYAANPSPAGLATSRIPALYVAESVLGSPQEIWMALAFMIATFTTLVPAFLAATRHIGSLGEDGFLPHSVSRVAWLFVLASIFFLAAAGQEFLVNITDYMVLVSLGVIALSAIWLRRERRKAIEREDFLALGVGLACFLAAAALYVVTPAVAVFGSLSIVVAFLVYDLLELGSLGTRLFVAALDVVTFVLLTAYPRSFLGPTIPVLPGFEGAAAGTGALRLAALLAAVVLVASVAADLVIRRTSRARVGPPTSEAEGLLR